MIDGICCVGSAHIDIIARQNGTHGIDQTGEVSVSVGGTAYNVACNLRHFGVNVALVTVIKDSIFGNIVLDKLKSYGIVTDWVIEDSGIPESVFIAVHGSDRLITAVNNLSVDKFHITNFPRANAYFVDLNNSVETLRSILARQKPVYIGLVSEEKAVRLATLLEIESPSCIQCVSGNKSEYAALLKVLNLASPEELSSCYPDVEFIYTMHEKGLKVLKTGKVVYEAQGIDANKVPYINGSRHIMGTGDAFIAGYIYAREIKSMEVSNAVDYAMANAVLLKLVTPG
ncbi:MAG: PfkB family carbohydrate kinase, partial [Candidatus Aenigmatarchaeota archaeon]